MNRAPRPFGPRGPVTERLLSDLDQSPRSLRWTPADDIDDEDLQLALYCCYELHYGGLPGVDNAWEWEPSLIGIRNVLESRFLAQLQTMVGCMHADTGDVGAQLRALASQTDGPSLSGWVARRATVAHLRELAVHRSAYQLKEADPHTWAIPRLGGTAKAVMVEIQADEYGNGSARRMHSTLFAEVMRSLDLDPTPNAYLDLIPAETLATTNLISLFGLHRRWRGALVGHLALFEMTSTGPMARYSSACRRLGLPERSRAFYDVHVQADRVHQHLAVDGMVAGLLADEPALAGDVLFGARALAAVEARFAAPILAYWKRGMTSLRTGAEEALGA